MSVITNELEDYDENREPSRWKINFEKLKAFIHTIREEDRKEMVKIAKNESYYCNDSGQHVIPLEEFIKALEITKE